MTDLAAALPAQRRDDAALGILSLTAGIVVFSAQDAIIKLISGDYPVYEAITIRSLVALPILWAMVAWNRRRASLATKHVPMLLLRGFIMFVSYTVYYLALAALPIATCVGLYFVAPLFITALSAVFLGEHVDARRWAAVLIGFAGVLVIIRPGSDVFDVAALLPVFAALAYGVSQVMARSLGEAASTSVMTFYANTMYIAGGLVLAAIFGRGGAAAELHPSLAFLVRGWVNPGLWDFLLMAACGVIAAAGLTLLSHAYRSARASTVAPFEYSAIIFTVAYGWFIWGEFPDLTAWLGILIVIAAGIYVAVTGRTAEPFTSPTTSAKG